LLNPGEEKLSIREDLKKGVYVQNLTEESVASAERAYELLQYGSSNRSTAPTSANAVSSRSHSVFTLYIESKRGDMVRYSRLHLIDLAGSERQKFTHASGVRLKESGHINKSLSTLGHVIRALSEMAQGRKRHVHYRDSLLTFLLKDSLGGNSKTSVIATVSPAELCFGETLSTLKFAQCAKTVKNKAVVNEEGRNGAANKRLVAEMKRLKEENEKLAVRGSENLERIVMGLNKRMKEMEEEKKRLLDRLDEFHRLHETSEYFAQSLKMQLFLKEQALARKEEEETIEKDDLVDELRREIAELKYEVQFHPQVIETTIEKAELQGIIESTVPVFLFSFLDILEYYEDTFGPDAEKQREEEKKLRSLLSDMTTEIAKLIQEKKLASSGKTDTAQLRYLNSLCRTRRT